MKEQVFAVQAENGNMLRGIVTLPDTMPGKKSGILLLGAGVNPRQTWHRLTIKIARLLAEDGFFSLRIDPQGIGDSDGDMQDIEPKELEKFHDAVQIGLFIDDCKSGLTKFKKDFNLDDLFIVGLCGGALTGLYLTNLVQEIKGLVYIAGPVTLSSIESSLPVRPGYSDSLFKGYVRKLFNPMAWMRFICKKSEYKTIFFLLKLRLLRLLGREHKIFDIYIKGENIEKKEIAEEGRMSNYIVPLVPQAFLKYMSVGGNIIFINAEVDQASWGFNNLFAPKYLDFRLRYKGKYEIKNIKRANHTFSSNEAQKELLSTIRDWMITFLR